MTQLSDEQQMIVSETQRIADQELADKAFTWEGELPWENIELLAEQGFVGLNFDEEYGGGGLSEYEVALQLDALGQVCPDTANMLRDLSFIGARVISMHGSREVKQEYLPGVTAGESFIAICISEPHAGSDAGNINTRMSQDADSNWYINGEKIWISHAPDSTAGVVWTKFPDDSMGAVVVDFDQEGFEIGENYTNMADQTQSHFFMEDVHVPEHRILASGPEGFKGVLRALNWERLGVAIVITSMAANAFEQAREYAKEREAFGQTLSEFQGLQWKFADMAKYIEASRMLNNRAVRNAVERDDAPDRLETSIANLFSSDVADFVVDEALQIHGAAGYMKEHPLEYMYRFVRGRRFGGGTDEVQKNQIADAVLEEGLPSDGSL